jgi:amino acid transporter
MSLLARDHRLPHMFYLRAERPVYRHGIVALALAALVLLVASGARTASLIPLYAIGVFLGFTISQAGLVRHWRRSHEGRWRARMVLNGTGAVMTAIATGVFLATKFTAGAWAVTIAIPVMMLLFARTERYYREVAHELKLGLTPPPPRKRESVVIVPSSTVNLLTSKAISAALSMGDTVIAIGVGGNDEECHKIKRAWDEWQPGVPIEVLHDPSRSLIRSVVRYVKSIEDSDVGIVVLIPQIIPGKRRHEILHNQRGRLLEEVLKSRGTAVVAILPFRLHD